MIARLDNDLRTLELARFNSHRELSRPEGVRGGGRGRGGDQCGGHCGPAGPGVTFLY